VGRIKRFLDFLPRPAAEALGRLMDSDKVMVHADMAGRAAYERRIAGAEPAPLESAEEPPRERVA
jgi:hypothetical protein